MKRRKEKQPETIIVKYRYRVIADFEAKDEEATKRFLYDQLFDDYKKARQLFDKLFREYDTLHESGHVTYFNRLFFERIII